MTSIMKKRMKNKNIIGIEGVLKLQELNLLILMVLLLLCALGNALAASLYATTNKSYVTSSKGSATVMVVSVVVPPLCVLSMPDTA